MEVRHRDRPTQFRRQHSPLARPHRLSKITLRMIGLTEVDGNFPKTEHPLLRSPSLVMFVWTVGDEEGPPAKVRGASLRLPSLAVRSSQLQSTRILLVPRENETWLRGFGVTTKPGAGRRISSW